MHHYQGRKLTFSSTGRNGWCLPESFTAPPAKHDPGRSRMGGYQHVAAGCWCFSTINRLACADTAFLYYQEIPEKRHKIRVGNNMKPNKNSTKQSSIIHFPGTSPQSFHWFWLMHHIDNIASWCRLDVQSQWMCTADRSKINRSGRPDVVNDGLWRWLAPDEKSSTH